MYNEKRKWLLDQYKLRNVEEVAVPWARKFLANVYSKPPFSRDELNAAFVRVCDRERLAEEYIKRSRTILDANAGQ